MLGPSIPDVPEQVFAGAVREFWAVREAQLTRQQERGSSDQGSRGAVTGGAQLAGFVETIALLLAEAGVPEAAIIRRNTLLPGYFRPTKAWDLLVVRDQTLVAAIECKSMANSFGNNFNNRVEEAVGSSVDLWTAFREGAFRSTVRPWLGYLFVLADVPRTRSPVVIKEPHFPVFDEFRGSSYAQRVTMLCQRLVLERHYDAACLVLTDQLATTNVPNYSEPADDLSARRFVLQLLGHTMAAFRA